MCRSRFFMLWQLTSCFVGNIKWLITLHSLASFLAIHMQAYFLFLFFFLRTEIYIRQKSSFLVGDISVDQFSAFKLKHNIIIDIEMDCSLIWRLKSLIISCYYSYFFFFRAQRKRRFCRQHAIWAMTISLRLLPTHTIWRHFKIYF